MGANQTRFRTTLWLARLLGGLIAAFWLMVLILNAIHGTPTWNLEEIGMLIMIVIALASTMVAFVRSRLGGRLLLVSGALFCALPSFQRAAGIG